MQSKEIHVSRTTEILKSKSVCSTDDVIPTCVHSQIVMKTNDSSFSSKSVSEIDYFSNTLQSLNWPEAYMGGKKAKMCLSKFDIKFIVFVYFESCVISRIVTHN